VRFSITVNPPPAPAWFTALPYSQWQLVGSNTLQSVATVAARTLTMPWIGAAVEQATKKFVIGNPGGHNDGGSNAVYEFRLNQATPAWVRTRVGTVVGAADSSNNFGTDSSGQPSNTHSYARPTIAAGRFWLPGLDSINSSNGWWTTATFSYDLAQTSGGVWRQHGRLTAGSIPSWIGGPACYDAVTDRMFSWPNAENSGPGYYFDVSNVLAAADVPSPGTVVGSTAINGPGFGNWQYSQCNVADGLRRIIWASQDSGTAGAISSVRTLQLDNLGAGWSTHNITGTTMFNVHYGGGYVYHEAARRIYSYNSSGNTIRVVEVPQNIANSWPARSVTLGGLTAGGTNSDNGSQGFSRFNIVQDMGNGEACLMWYPTHTLSGMYVCRVPAGGL
jgi:hypothetical protein